MIIDWIGRHDVLLPIDQNYDKIREKNKPWIERWTTSKLWNAEKASSSLNKVHRNSARKMTRTVQLQAWHCLINAQIRRAAYSQPRLRILL